MPDPFDSFSVGLESPASHAYAVTPNDAQDLPVSCRALNVAQGGTVRVTTVGGDDVTIAVTEGSPFPLRCRRIWATGTSATGGGALY